MLSKNIIDMIVREVRPEEKSLFNKVVTHPLQSWEWGEFRQQTGVDVIRLGLFDNDHLINGLQATIHPIPKVPYTLGYIPKCRIPQPELIQALKDVGREQKALFFKLEPNIATPAHQREVHDESEKAFPKERKYLFDQGCVYGKPLFTKYSFILDLSLSDEELFEKMKPKTRYNVRLAHKKGVKVIEDNSPDAFEKYLHLTFNVTTKRQKFYAHDRDYHTKMWKSLQPTGIAHLLKATYEGKTLVTWIVFIFNNTLYYPYGASSNEERNVMPNEAMMWAAIQFGKHHGCKYFDMWGSLGPDASSSHPWHGFHRFKEGFGPRLMEFIGTYDLVLDLPKYQVFKVVDQLRWHWLRIKSSLPI